MEINVVAWETLEHAYGTAEDIPALLAQLASFPEESSYQQEPWFSLWSSLCHQGDIYSASFAAVPEIVRHLASAPHRATHGFFLLPAAIEIARVKDGITVPPELHSAYFESVRALGSLAASWAGTQSNSLIAQAAISAFAVSVGQHAYAELVLEIPENEIPEVFAWYWER